MEEIERDNQTLLCKMNKIMRTQGSVVHRHTHKHHRYSVPPYTGGGGHTHTAISNLSIAVSMTDRGRERWSGWPQRTRYIGARDEFASTFYPRISLSHTPR